MKINGWKCDVCKKDFFDGMAGFSANTSFTIEIPSSGAFDQDNEFDFDDICVDCKAKLVTLLNNFTNGRL